MKYLLIENEEGQYINNDQNKRYDLLECHKATGPRAKDFVEFENLQEAQTTYGLVKISEDESNEEI